MFASVEFIQFSGRFAGPSVACPTTTFCRAQYLLSEWDAQSVLDAAAAADGDNNAEVDEMAATKIRTRTLCIVPHRRAAG